MPEVEVFRLNTFDKALKYGFALKTRTSGRWPNEQHYTSNTIEVLGNHIDSKRWGYRDSSGGSETFVLNGVVREVVYDYEGLTCFVVV